MEVLTQAEVKYRFDELVELIKEGALFIHPTDTIYAIGCVATNKDAVAKLREVKQSNKPFPIWAPSQDWIKSQCTVSKEALEQLPGPITLKVKAKKNSVASNVTERNELCVRLPDHWMQRLVEVVGEPIITTSANKTGEMLMTDIENLDADIQKKVAFCIYEGEKAGKPAKIISFV